MKPLKDRISLLLFFASTIVLAFGSGMAVVKYKMFPYQIFALAEEVFTELSVNEGMLPWYYRRVEKPYLAPIRNTGQAFQGLNLVTRIVAGRELSAEIIDMNGRKIQVWEIDWFKMWPDPEHLPEDVIPKSKPGTHIHGAVILKNGDLVFNFEHLGMVRIDRNSNVVWRLPYRTHHSIHMHDDGNLWVCGQKLRMDPNPHFPHRIPPFDEYTILEVSPQGEILQEWSISEILYENGQGRLMPLSAPKPHSQILNDLLHLNDVEPFSSTMEEGFFKDGDILVSLRNINTVFVFNRYSRKIKFLCTGWFVQQHDPDFIDGNRFSVFDNCYTSEDHGLQSRIVIVSAADNKTEVFFVGSSEKPFFTKILGKHQWLPNGSLLITESVQGRAFEINRQGKIVWEYVNYVDRGVVGLVEEVQRLAPCYIEIFQ